MKVTGLLRMVLLSDFIIFKLISWALYSIYTWLLLWGLGTWGVGWIVVVLGFSQTDITVPQFPEAQQPLGASVGTAQSWHHQLSCSGSSHIQRSKGGVWERGKEWESRNNVTAVPLLTSLWCLCQCLFYFFMLAELFRGKGGWNKNKPLLLLFISGYCSFIANTE